MKQHLLPAILLASVFFIIGVATLSHYGMHEDAPFHFLRGQYYLERVMGGDGVFAVPPLQSPVLFRPGQRISSYKINASEELNVHRSPVEGTDSVQTIQQEFAEVFSNEGRRSSSYKHNAWGANIWDIENTQGHPAISDMLMALSNRIVYEWFGWLSDIEAYHLYIVVVVGLAMMFLYLFAADAFGRFTAIFSVSALALYPMVFAESHFNIKDPVQMGYYTMAVVAAYFCVTRALSVDWLAVLVVSIFLALGTKWNIVFLPFILLPWMIIVGKSRESGQRFPWRRVIVFCGVAGIVPFILLVFLYPFYWTQTLFKLLGTFDFYLSLAVKDLRIQQPTDVPLPAGLDARAVLQVLSMSPPVMLILAGIGVIGVIGRKISGKYHAGLLIILWLIVPLIRVIWQTSEIFGSLRHFMEFIPAFAVLVGVGAAGLIGIITRWLPVRRRMVGLGILILFLIVHIALLLRWHPYEHIYFNRFFGGLAGARERGLYRWETVFDAPYKDMATWLNRHAETGARLAYLDGTMLGLSPLWLREDIRFGSYFSGLDKQGEYIASMVYPKPPAVFPINYLEAFVRPVHEILVDGVAVAKIWKNDTAHTAVGTRKTVDTSAIDMRLTHTDAATQGDLTLPHAGRILSATVEASDIRCITVGAIVWAVTDRSTVSYLVPWITQESKQRATLWFPGVMGSGIRWLDRGKSGCRIRILDVVSVQYP